MKNTSSAHITNYPRPENRPAMFWFIGHLIIYSVTLVSVVIVNMVVAPGHPWFLLILFGWCGLMILHAGIVMGAWTVDHQIAVRLSQRQAADQEKDRFGDGLHGEISVGG